LVDDVKVLLKTLLGPAYGLLGSFYRILFPFFDSGNLHWVFLASSAAIALVVYLTKSDPAGKPSLQRVRLFLMPPSIYGHPSAVLDYKFYVVNSFVLAQLRLGTWMGAIAELFYVAAGTRHALVALLGPQSETDAAPSIVARFVFTLLMVVVIDLGKFTAHYLQHRVPVLWEFHKIHHAAAVLTPITAYRIHPVDFVLEQFLIGLLIGTVSGAFSYWFPSGVTELTLLNISVIYFLYLLSANLRHSHIALPFGRRTSHVVSSPLMHQIHHSAEVRHVDKNFALVFSLWDYLVGTLYIPGRPEEFRLGLSPNPGERFDSLRALYVDPFVAAFERIRRPTQSPVSPG
jgi:sterol desaturase/sphingolipid hydroxylase (fatty acid hydroxylase superfamily)